MMRPMNRQRRMRRGASILAAMTVCIASATVSAAAATLPPRAEVRIPGALDVQAFEQSVASRYDVHFRKVVATDIDRDGDLDFIAATDAGLVVWLNDGAGRLTSSTPTRAPLGAGGSSDTSWQDHDERLDLSIQNASPTVPLPTAFAHAPPTGASITRPAPTASLRLQISLGCRSPRAPPA
jgi:hypothetical protein